MVENARTAFYGMANGFKLDSWDLRMVVGPDGKLRNA